MKHLQHYSTIKQSQIKGVFFLVLNYGSCFLCLLATLLVITFPIFFAFFAYACMMYG